MSKKKIAVLGGGIGSLSSVFALTSDANWQEKYDITLYQLGWRLGGKGASGRNAELGERIEEHGIHVWLGFYDNSFRAMRACYEELGREQTAPLATIDDAFKKHSFITVKDFYKDEWKNWYIDFPENSKVPGEVDKRECFSPFDYIKVAVKWIISRVEDIEHFHIKDDKERDIHEKMKPLVKLLSVDEDIFHKSNLRRGGRHLKILDKLFGLLDLKKDIKYIKDLIHAFEHLLKEIEEILTSDIDYTISRIISSIEFSIYCIKGMILDGVIFKGFDVIDNLDFRAWLKSHGAPDRVVYFAPIRAFYDLALAYPKGITGDQEPTREGNISAGVALHSMLLMVFEYKGAIMWKMQSGMGDVVFTPFYQVLKRRGVKFEFFHRVTDLIPNEDGSEISSILINKQVDLKDPSQEYNPLVDVKGLPCWPSTPNFDQIVQGQELKDRNINLESMWADWAGVENLTLQKGVDFDEVICGIPITALDFISKELASKSKSWSDMVTYGQSVRTLAMQNWFNVDLKGLGWEEQSTILDAYVQRFNTWADMSQTLKTEDWNGADEPLNVGYFCGTLEDGENPFPPESDHNYPAEVLAKVKAHALSWTKDNAEGLWSNIKKDGEIDWSLYFDTEPNSGVKRFDWQYFRANIDPAERYSLSVADTNQYRLKAHESDFKNIYLAGDWVDNGFLNVGCIEATVISGLKCAEALSGESQNIIF